MKKIFVMVVAFLLTMPAMAEVNKKYVKSAEQYLNSVTGLSGDLSKHLMVKRPKGCFLCCVLGVCGWIIQMPRFS